MCGMVYVGLYYDQTIATNNHTLLAVKEIPLNKDLEITEGLISEINLLRNLKSRNIV